MTIALIFDINIVDGSVESDFFDEVIKAIPAGIFAVIASYIAVVLTFIQEKKKERKKAAREERQLFEYLRMNLEKAYKDNMIQLRYLREYSQNLVRFPAELATPSVHGRHYLNEFVTQIDKKSFYFTMNNEGMLDTAHIGKVQSSLFYIHDVYHEIYVNQVATHTKMDHERRIRLQNVELELRNFLTAASIDDTKPDEQSIAQEFLGMFYAFSQKYGKESLENRVQILFQDILDALKKAQVEKSFEKEILTQIHNIIDIYSNIKFNNEKMGEFMSKYYGEILIATRRLRKSCNSIPGIQLGS